MQISKNKVVSLSYQLTVDGDVVDKATSQKPLSFIFGRGVLLPKFETNIEGKRAGDAFKFTLSPTEGYGEFDENGVKEFPLDAFMIDGQLEEGLLTEGAVIPMQDNEGNVFSATVLEVKENSVELDFNHPLADMELNFEGDILEVRDATEKELAKGLGCGCSCNDNDNNNNNNNNDGCCGSDGCCDDDDDCSCSCEGHEKN
ncbi:MAG: peptidylprolyl isomerase [Prevotellaceae bacterium]|jgi:FKBP-type peptidyl-prolyl cis-trans isomerase SlyD|nr:peptidylprolyl isomerase [Prevotellaceae bacterium]